MDNGSVLFRNNQSCNNRKHQLDRKGKTRK